MLVRRSQSFVFCFCLCLSADPNPRLVLGKDPDARLHQGTVTFDSSIIPDVSGFDE
jgi:hypothetical protein